MTAAIEHLVSCGAAYAGAGIASPGAGVPPRDGALRAEVMRGLRGSPKTLPPKLFYDATGAQLFERICTLPEYYLTRSELEILRERAGEIAELAGARCALIEYGSGAGVKIRLLLDALEEPAAYVPVDISREQLAQVAGELAAEYPDVAVRPQCADYTAPLTLPSLPPDARRVAFFPGSTIGNFHPAEAAAFLHRVRHTVGAGGLLVLGVDRRKRASILNAAYNDAAGVTAAFNLNMLARLNREMDADFDLDAFEHRAAFNAKAGRVEMHLVSRRAQVLHVAGEPITFGRRETIWTECSYKYDRARLDRLVQTAGFSIARLWTDAPKQFWVAVLTAS
ncbi:MAG TPA: L-histidine N(alpha)-methyltransferase [Gemmatimonadaceae bacterium]|nr:L-histidine N(alpha)-methyltransferase [Gemmatimonadaceae bacterium]